MSLSVGDEIVQEDAPVNICVLFVSLFTSLGRFSTSNTMPACFHKLSELY